MLPLVEVFRRRNARLELFATLAEPDRLTTPLAVWADLFVGIPAET